MLKAFMGRPRKDVSGGPQKGLHLPVDLGGEVASYLQLLLGIPERCDCLFREIGELRFYRLSFPLPVLISKLQVGFSLDG